jgi:transaldolase
LNIKIFVDCADPTTMLALSKQPEVQGFTTNPTLMRKAHIIDYEMFVRTAVERIPDKPISFEVFADNPAEMYYQAQRLANMGKNIYVKIPITNTEGKLMCPLIYDLGRNGINVNVTAVTTIEQVCEARDALTGGRGIISIFAGRIADTGKDPMRKVNQAVNLCAHRGWIEILWASTREVYNVVQADQVGCHIITVSPDILAKLPLLGKDLDEFSLETVKQFRDDAVAAGYSL